MDAQGLYTLPKSISPSTQHPKHFLPYISQVTEELMCMPQYSPLIHPMRSNYPCVHKFLVAGLLVIAKGLEHLKR